jgi:hypothetical protein
MSHHRESKARSCPKCDREIGSHRELTAAQRPPRSGDYTVCAACLSPLRFTANGFELADLQKAPPNIRETLSLTIAAAKAQREVS